MAVTLRLISDPHRLSLGDILDVIGGDDDDDGTDGDDDDGTGDDDDDDDDTDGGDDDYDGDDDLSAIPSRGSDLRRWSAIASLCGAASIQCRWGRGSYSAPTPGHLTRLPDQLLHHHHHHHYQHHQVAGCGPHGQLLP